MISAPTEFDRLDGFCDFRMGPIPGGAEISNHSPKVTFKKSSMSSIAFGSNPGWSSAIP